MLSNRTEQNVKSSRDSVARADADMKHFLAAAVAAITVSFGFAPASADADTTAPYGDAATDSIADRLHGRARGGRLATTLDCCGQYDYYGRRHAEIVKIPDGHGKRWVGIIHVPGGRARAVHRVLVDRDAWFAQNGTRFVLPLKNQYDTSGDSTRAHRRAAAWAVKRLGDRWRLVAP